MKLKNKIILFFMICIVAQSVIYICFVFYAAHFFYSQYSSDLIDSAKYFSVFLMDSLNANTHREEVINAMNIYRANHFNVMQFTVYDLKGNIICSYDNGVHHFEITNADENKVSLSFLNQIQTNKVIIKKAKHLKQNIIELIYPCTKNNTHVYTIHYKICSTRLYRQFRIVKLSIFGVTSILMMIGLFIIAIYSNKISNSITKLLNKTNISINSSLTDFKTKPTSDELELLDKNVSTISDELKDTQNIMFQTIQSMSSGIIIATDTLHVLALNNAVKKLFSITNVSTTEHLFALFPEMEQFYTQILNVLNNKTEMHIPYFTLESFDNYTFTITITPFSTDHYNGIVIRIDDVTKITLLTQRLSHYAKNEIISSLSGGLAHDFNNILGTIKATVGLIQEEITSIENFRKDSIDESFSILNSSIIKASTLVNKLLTIGKKQEFSLTIHDLHNLINNVVHICRKTMKHGITIITRFYRGKILIAADQASIEEALFNILINACHAMTIMKSNSASTGIILIATSKITVPHDIENKNYVIKKGSYWIVTIQDEGIGIPKNNIKKIFNPFFTTKPQGIGTGLGLAMVSTIIEQHKGHIVVNSEENYGTSVSLLFPKTIE